MGDRYGRRQHRIVGGSSDAGRANDALSAYFEDSEPQRAGGCAGARAQYGERFPRVFRSITSDNGSEFAALPEQLPETTIYYAHPYSSYERGLNEKQNSLIRRFFPKGRSLDGVPPDAVQRVQDWVNLFPRKAFRYASPDSLFRTVLFDIAI